MTARSRGRWVGTWRLAWIHLRTGWTSLVGWPVAVAVLVAAIATGIAALYPDAASRRVYAATLGASPATMALNGRGYDLDTLGGITVYEVGIFGLLAVPVIAIHLAIRHSRTQEDVGRADLVTASPVGRLAPLAAATAVVAGGLLVGSIATLAALVSTGLPVVGAIWYTAALMLYGLLFLAAGLLAGQVSQTARGAYAVGLGSVAVCYVARLLIDGQGGTATWATPMGWLAEVRPFGTVRLWPLLAMAALTLVIVMITAALARTGDLGAGIIPARRGPARAAGHLHQPLGLTWRLTRLMATGWVAGTAAWGLALGLLTEEVRTLAAANPTLVAAVGGADSRPEHLITSFGAILIALFACAVLVQGLGRLAAEESSGRLGVALSTRLSRVRWWLGALGLLVGQSGAVLLVGGVALGLGSWLSTGRPAGVGDAIVACLSYGPAVALVGAVAAILLSVSTRIVPLGWLMVVWSAVVALLADTLRLPPWSRGLAPLHHVGRVPTEQLDVAAALTMAMMGSILVLASVLLFRRRDLAAG